jgi:hypothetical protein
MAEKCATVVQKNKASDPLGRREEIKKKSLWTELVFPSGLSSVKHFILGLQQLSDKPDATRRATY